MDTTSHFGVYLLLKNKVFGHLVNYLSILTVWRKVSCVSSRRYKEPLFAP